MKLLNDILINLSFKEIKGNTDIIIENITFDSRKVKKGDLFIAIKGNNNDGHKFINQAIENEASAIIYSDKSAICDIPENVTHILVEDTSKTLGIIASNFYNNPSKKIKLIGVTGTNGKTTTATLLYKITEAFGKKSGLISTVKYLIHNKELPATHTTPDAISINKLLSEMLENGCEYCFMEVSSHAVDQKRIEGLTFTGGIFTNITHDHLDYHKTFNNYLIAKKGFFDILPPTAFALVNKDDNHWNIILQNTKAKKYSFAIYSHADFKGKILEEHFDSQLIKIDDQEVWIKLIGEFNVYNVLGIYSTAVLLGFDKQSVIEIISKLDPVEGRFETIHSPEGIIAVVDYAHTPDALANVINTINKIRKGKEKLITVFGCGGNRDSAKRPEMGKIATSLSDKVIITSDNPRDEDPEEIIHQVYKGVPETEKKKVLCITNRREAIKTAYSIANSGDIILIAGKGHEKYQEIKGVRYHFDDVEEIKNLFYSKN